MQLEIERQALKKEKDKASAERLSRIEQELADLREQSLELRSRWETEKQAIGELRSLKEQIEETRLQIEQAERRADLETAARLRYGTLRDLENRLAAQEKRLKELQSQGALLKEEVDAEDIAQIVSRWTGIPVSKLLEGEMDRLVHMEDRLHTRVIGQAEAVRAVANAVRALALRPARSRPADRFLPVPRPDRGRQDGTGARPGGVSIRRRTRHGPHRHG